MKDNIVLIGMPGVGISSAGVVLAKVLGYKFLDTDILIQEETNMLLKDIIEKEGLDKFKEIENNINAKVTANRTVIATGGSVVFGAEAMEHLKSIGKVVYLKAGYDEINKRLGNLKGRGVAMEEGQTLFDIYEERVPLYEKYAEITVDETGKDIRETVNLILEKL